MKKKLIAAALALMFVLSFGLLFCAEAAAASPDEAVISQNDGKITPIPTEPAEAVQSGASSSNFSSSADYALFYTQTTLLALLAGYLIIFKVKGTKTNEKMHRRKS